MEQLLIQVGTMFGFGGIVAVILLYQNKQRNDRESKENADREARMGARLDAQADMIQNTLLAALRDNQTTLQACKSAIDRADATQARSNELLEELIDLRREELQHKKDTLRITEKR